MRWTVSCLFLMTWSRIRRRFCCCTRLSLCCCRRMSCWMLTVSQASGSCLRTTLRQMCRWLCSRCLFCMKTGLMSRLSRMNCRMMTGARPRCLMYRCFLLRMMSSSLTSGRRMRIQRRMTRFFCKGKRMMRRKSCCPYFRSVLKHCSLCRLSRRGNVVCAS